MDICYNKIQLYFGGHIHETKAHNFFIFKPFDVADNVFGIFIADNGTSATVWDGSVADSFAAGTGTKDDPYIIRTAPQLAYLSQFWGYFGAEAVHVRLESDIYLNDTTDWEKWGSEENGTIVTPANNWTPIAEMPFDASFDGNGHTIYGMFAFQQNKQSGLFGYAYGNICNLTIAQSYVEGSRYVGAIAGGLFNGGTIVNSHNSGTVKGQQYVGGVCGNQ